MRIIISLVMMLLPGLAFAAGDCQVVEYPDHSEAVCVGEAPQLPASSGISGQEQASEQEQPLASAQTAESEQQDVAPPAIVRNDLARLHGDVWLRTRPGK